MHRKSVYLLLLSVSVLLVMGIVMLYSTSAFARETQGDALSIVKKQVFWLMVSSVVMVMAASTDYHFWARTWLFWFGLAVVLLALCYVDPIGRPINGARRWLHLGPATFQPSELGKLAAIVFLAQWFAKHVNETREFLKGFIAPAAVVGVLMLLIVREVDLGTTALIGGTTFIVMFVAGSRLLFLMPVAIAGLAGIGFAALHMRERMERLLAFMDLEKYKEGAGLQQWQALIAFGSGGVEGLGLGNGRQKMLYLPFAHTDFIFPMIGEELGLRFTLLVVFCFVVFILCGTVIAVQARDRFGMLLGFGAVSIVALQAAVNIGVTTSLLPNKGMPLPFISYGGSNLLFCMAVVGILINIYRQGINDSSTGPMNRLNAKMTPRI